MIPGYEADDAYRMVEDELLAVASKYTRHLHTAEYARLKSTVKARVDANVGADGVVVQPLDMAALLAGRRAGSAKRKRRSRLELDHRRDLGSDSEEVDDMLSKESALYGLLQGDVDTGPVRIPVRGGVASRESTTLGLEPASMATESKWARTAHGPEVSEKGESYKARILERMRKQRAQEEAGTLGDSDDTDDLAAGNGPPQGPHGLFGTAMDKEEMPAPVRRQQEAIPPPERPLVGTTRGRPLEVQSTMNVADRLLAELGAQPPMPKRRVPTGTVQTPRASTFPISSGTKQPSAPPTNLSEDSDDSDSGGFAARMRARRRLRQSTR